MTVQAIYAGGQYYQVSGGGYSPKGEIRLGGDRTQKTNGDTPEKSLPEQAQESLSELPVALQECLTSGVLCNDARLKQTGEHWSVEGDPTEGALIAAAAKADLSQTGLAAAKPRLDAIPFESQYQYMATLHEADPQTIYVKGSLEAILSRCTQMLNQQGQPVSIDQEKIEQAVEAMTAKALRVLAFAKKTCRGPSAFD